MSNPIDNSDDVFAKLVPPRNVLFQTYGAYNEGDFDFDDVEMPDPLDDTD